MAGRSALTGPLYYPKFLARADTHVYQVFAVVVPLLVYAVYRVVTLLEDYVPPARHWITAATVAAAMVLAPVSLTETAEGIPKRTSAQAHYERFSPRFSDTNRPAWT